MTNLHRAAGDYELTKALLEHGADVNARDEEGFTPLHSLALYSTKLGNEDFIKCAELLIKYGADVNAKTKADDELGPPKTPIEMISHSEKKIAKKLKKLLIKAGAQEKTE